MKIIIVGCGRVGQTLAAELNNEGNDIIVVDQNPIKVKEVAIKYDLMGVIGNGATRDTQKEAGVDTADLLIAVTGSDELNLLCCVMAKKAGNCQTIARVKSPEYAQDSPYLKDELGLAMVINPEYEAAKEISRIMSFPSAIKVDVFAKGRVELLKFRIPEHSPLVGLSVREAMTKFRCNVLICTVERGDESFIPRGNFVFAERDIISIIGAPKSALAFFAKIDKKIEPVKDVIIIGADNITYYVCEMLSRAGIAVKVIDKRLDRCEEICTRFDNVTVINADHSDEATLREEGVKNTDAFISLTGLDEENILLSLYAKNEGAKKVVTKINRIEYDEVIARMELDSIIYPKNITAAMILRYVRATNNTLGSSMETLYTVIKGQVVAAEFSVGTRSPIAGRPLSELSLRENVIIAAILRGKSIIFPRGSDVIEPGDSVVVVTKLLGIKDVSDIIQK